MYEGKTVENMVDWLYENCGQPAQSFESISPETLRTSTTSTEPSIQILRVDFRGGLQRQWAAVRPGSQPQTRRQFKTALTKDESTYPTIIAHWSYCALARGRLFVCSFCERDFCRSTKRRQQLANSKHSRTDQSQSRGEFRQVAGQL